MKQRRKASSYEPDPLDLRSRRRKRQQRERRLKWLLTAAAILLIILIAVIFRQIALKHFGRGFIAPIENPTYWFEQTEGVRFLTATPTLTPTLTPTVPTPTPTVTLTPTPTISPTPTLSPTPKLRPRKTLEGNAADLLIQAESTLTAKHILQQAGSEPVQYSEFWFELLGGPSVFDPAEVYPNSDCTWMGVAGVLIDKRGDPQIGFYVQVGFADGSIEETLSGLFPGYGPSGYEVTLARPVRPFDKPVWIQILDEDRLPASEKIYFRPNSDCKKSLTMINFQRTQ